MVTLAALELGRSAVAGRRRREACECFAEAQSALAEGLAPPDLELMAMALYLRGGARRVPRTGRAIGAGCAHHPDGAAPRRYPHRP